MKKKIEKKIVGLTACILAIALVCSVAEAQDITTGLVGYWKLDETSGTTAYNDVAGGSNGAFVGDPDLPTWVDGPVDGAIDFDCTDGDDARYVTCDDYSALDITGDRSMAAWIKIDDWNANYWAGLFTKGGSNDGSYNLIQGRLYTDGSGSDHGIAFQVKGINQYPPDGVKRQQVVRGAVTVDDGEWHLAVGTFHHDRGDGTGLLSIYVDGVLDADYVVGNGATATNDNPIWINGQYGTPGVPHTGFPNSSIDDARIYNRALTAEDVAYMYSLVNAAPQVDAGTFMGALVDTATQLAAVVSDDGQPDPPSSLTYAWSKLSGPGAVEFSDAAIENPTVTFDAIGAYELQLSVSDSERDACDVLDVLVRASDDPIAHWDFETGTGTNVVDRSANNNFGTFAGDPEPNWASGWVGTWALEVADNSYVEITADPTVGDPNLDTMYGAVTVSAWFKVDEWMSDSWDGIVTKGKGDGTPDGYGGWLLMRNSSTDSLAFSTPGPGMAKGSVNVNDGHWHHAVGVHNGTTISLYVDGVLDASVEADGLVIPKTAKVWINGNSQAEVGEELFFDGLIDDVRIYDYAISESKIAELLAMGQGFPPQVDAGADTTFYVRYGSLQLDATVTDETPPQATLLWTQESGPGTVEFSDATIEDPTATFSEVGEYLLRLTADDPLAVVYDEVTITVEDPTCQDVISDGLLLMADLSGPEGTPDCYIDLFDFAAFAGNWLRCNDPQNLECEFPY